MIVIDFSILCAHLFIFIKIHYLGLESIRNHLAGSLVYALSPAGARIDSWGHLGGLAGVYMVYIDIVFFILFGVCGVVELCSAYFVANSA